ncbi:hypothetical protein V499_05152 [Pseudogymnoascus sp. VKM F-103]|nr:hypothetical protein V499_05152 [Pseudogymnoascus sp. VKM F-103]
MGYLFLHRPPSVLEPLQDASDTRAVPEFTGVYPLVYVCFPATGSAVGYIPWPCGVCAVIVALLFEAFFVDETLVDVFDATLLSRHQEALLSPSRTIFPAASNPVKALGPPTEKAVYGPFSFRQIAEFVLFLPLNFIPFAGVPLFLILTGRRAGPLQHWRYFKLRGLGRKERNKEVESRRWGYTWFGTIALLLQLVPVLSMFFLLTSAAGSALWVADLEEARQQQLLAAESVVGGAQVDDEFPPEYTDTEDQMHLLVYLGLVLVLCGISSAAPAAAAALFQDGNPGKLCSIITVYVTVTEDPSLPDVKTFGIAHHLVTTSSSIPVYEISLTDLHKAETQHLEAASDGLAITVTRTHTGFKTVTVTINISGVPSSDINIWESTSVRFLHDGPSPTEKQEQNLTATLTTTFQPLNGTEGPKVPETVNTTSQSLAVPTESDGSKAPLMVNTASQYLTAPTGTAATKDPVTVNTTSQYLTAPTGTGVPTAELTVNSTSPTEAQSGSGGDDVAVETVTVYPVKSIAPETNSNDSIYQTVAAGPTPHDPVSASLFSGGTETTPTHTVGILTNVTIRAQSPSQRTTLAAMKGFANDESKPLERKDGMYSIPKEQNAYLTPGALGAIPFVPLIEDVTKITLGLPFITTVTVPVDFSKATVYTSGRSFSTYIPGLGEVRFKKPTTTPADSTTYMARPPGTHAPLVPLDEAATVTLKIPFIATVTFPADLSKATTYTSGHFFSTYIPGAREARMRKPTPDLADSTTATSTRPLVTVVTSCGEQGIFRLTFDDIPRLAGPANSNDVQPQPISNPYHHFYFSQGFVVAPPPKDPYTPKSAPLLLDFVTQSTADVTRTHNSPPIDEYGATGEIGIGQNLQWGCYTFHALAASVGCDSLGPQCDWQFTGVQFNPRKQEYEEVVT